MMHRTACQPLIAAARQASLLTLFAWFGLLLGSTPGMASDFSIDATHSQLKLHGDATVHGWKCASREVQGLIEAPVTLATAEAAFTNAMDQELQAVISDLQALSAPLTNVLISLVVPVASLKSGNARMEADLQSALKADQHPEIRCKFDSVSDIRLLPPVENPTLAVTAHGSFSLAGVTRPATVALRVDREAHGRYRLHGVHEVRMSDFKITPPTALFGLIRAGDAVVVTIDLLITPPPDSP